LLWLTPASVEWDGWKTPNEPRGGAHHVVVTAVAFTFLQPRPTLPIVRGWVREIMSPLYVIHNRRLLSMLDSFRRMRRPEDTKCVLSGRRTKTAPRGAIGAHACRR
jgi:hypothetical protein